MNFKKRKNGLLAHRFEASCEIFGKGFLPKFDLIGELGLGDDVSLWRDVDAL